VQVGLRRGTGRFCRQAGIKAHTGRVGFRRQICAGIQTVLHTRGAQVCADRQVFIADSQDGLRKQVPWFAQTGVQVCANRQPGLRK
jgi:hypothetical protein